MTDAQSAKRGLVDRLRRRRNARKHKAAERARLRGEQRAARGAYEDLQRKGIDSGGIGGNISGAG